MKLFTVSLLLLCSLAHGIDSPSPTGQPTNWPRFRGADGSGFCPTCDAPLTFDVQTGTNLAWSTEVPAEGFSSPIVWGDRVFLSGGDAEKREIMCFTADTGKLVWKRAVPHTKGSPDGNAEVPDQCGMAAATMATDGVRVFAIFANSDLAAFTLDGDLVWAKYLAAPNNDYGHATSLLTWKDRVIVQFDQGDPDDQLSRLYAFDGATGNVVWQQPRPTGASWATPILFNAAGKTQLVTQALPWVISYAVETGKEIWRAECLDGEVTPSPIFAYGTLYVVSPSSKLQTIRPDGTGDVTRTHLGWKAEDGIPDVTSPVCNGELVFLVDSSGTLTCYDAKSGKKEWTQDLEEEVNASPSIVGRHLAVITKKGRLIVFEATRTCKEVARSALQEEVLASPGFSAHAMFVRGTKHLFCIRAKP